jgi:Tol biopolymer transport system component
VLLLATAPLFLSLKGEARALGATGDPVWSAEAGATASGAPSIDGHYFPCHSFEIPVAVCNVTTGIVQRVPLIEPVEDGWGARPLISPDGQRVAYQGLAHEEAKIFDLSTSTSKSLPVDSSLRLRIIEWRASGDALLVVLSPFFSRPPDGEPHYLSSVALLETATGTLTTLKQFDETPGDVALSHDGSRLAFTQHGDLYVADLVSGESHHIAGPSSVGGSLLWMPNDDGILFTSGKNVSEVQLMRLTDGLRVAETQVLRPHGGSPVSLLGVSVTGDVYYNAVTEPMLYVAPFDAATQQIGPPDAIAIELSSVGMDWSPDSKSIAYARWDQTRMLRTIVIRNVATSVEREIELPDDSPNHRLGGGVHFIRWSPQGSILASDLFNFYLVHLDETSIRRIGAATPATSSVEWSPNGATVLRAGGGLLQRFDVVTGQTTESYSLPDIAMGAQVSPEQELVAFSSRRDGKFEISLQGLGNGVSRTLLVSDRQCRPVGWWKREVFVACRDDSMRLPPLYLLDTLGGTMKALDANLRGIGHVRVRPDDRAIAILAATTKFSNSTFILKLPGRYWQKAQSSVMPQR